MLLAGATTAVHLGSHALIDPDEGRTASIALAMATSGDFLVPRFNGLPFLDKPGLFYATQALAMRRLGATETAARLPALLAAWGTAAATAWFAARLFGPDTAWIAGTAALTAPLALAMARTARADSLLALFMVVALMAFFQAVEGRAGGHRWLGWTLVAWAAMAAGVLVKGPVALAVPLLVAAPWAAWRRRSIAVWHPAGGGLFLLVVVPWALAVEARVPGFLRYGLVTETWERLTRDSLQRGGPVWYFLPYLVAGCLPWLVVVVASAFDRSRLRAALADPVVVFLVAWVVLPLLFFSLSQSKRPQYLLPVVPAVALLAARAWSRLRPPLAGARAAAGIWIALGGVLVLAATAEASGRVPAELASAARPALWILGLLMVAAGGLAWSGARRPLLAPMALSLPLLALPLATAPLMDAVAARRSARDLAAALPVGGAAGVEVVGIETFSPSLTFYLGRPIRLSTATGAPLGSNYVLRHYAELVIAEPTSLCPAGCWHRVLAECARPAVFLLRPGHTDRAVLAGAGLPVLFESRKLLAMGPCAPGGRNGDGPDQRPGTPP
jgi:4-amino-4-deoxy-L-arabinose transferase-like glycosyltransferase